MNTHYRHHRTSKSWQLSDPRKMCAPEKVGGTGGLIAAACVMALFYLSFLC